MATAQTPPITEAAARAVLPGAAVFISGNEVPHAGGERHVHVHPADGKPLGEWTLAGPDDVDRAVRDAQQAQLGWAAASPSQRRVVLSAVAAKLRERQVELAAVMSLEMGMPIRAAVAGVGGAAEWFDYYAGWADKIAGAAPLLAGSGAVHDYTVPSPYGVVAAIIPWNGPAIALALKSAPALAAGNAVVVKPSELAPLSSVAIAQAAVDAGLPAGLLNVVSGGPSIGQALCEHPGVGIISFTGGNVGGRAVGRLAADRYLPVLLELGGKSASLLFADCDVARVSRLAATLGVAQNSGQGCFLPTRLLVERTVYDQVIEALATATDRFKLGKPFADGTVMGPVVSEGSSQRILGIIGQARDVDGASLIAGGHRATGELADGYFIEPTIFADVAPGSALATEEVFGPVLSVTPFEDEDEAISMANASEFGLAGYVWTESLRRAHRVASRLDAGYVSVNSMAALPPGAPFGGWKASGHGIEGGPQGIAAFLRTKNVHVAL